MATFLHIFVKPKPGVTEDQVKKTMDLSLDWYKYSDYCWVVKTSSDVAKWQARLQGFAEKGGNLLILTIDPSKRQGWMAKAFWDWLKKATQPDAPSPPASSATPRLKKPSEPGTI